MAHECCRGDIEPLSNFARGQKCNIGLCFTFWFQDQVALSFISSVLEFWGPQTKACFLVWRKTCRIPASVFARWLRHWHRQADLRRGQLHWDLSACWQTMPIAVELSCKYSHTVCANVLGTTRGLQTGPYRIVGFRNWPASGCQEQVGWGIGEPD